MAVQAPFQGNLGENQEVNPGGASSLVNIPPGNKSIRLVNSGANICHVRIGQGVQTATTADTPVLAGESLILSKADQEDTVAYISSAGTTLHIQPGEGGI